MLESYVEEDVDTGLVISDTEPATGPVVLAEETLWRPDAVSAGRQRVVYVASIAHSGSTAFDILLGAMPEVTSLGQLADVTHMDPEIQECSCGSSLQDCSYWGPLFEDRRFDHNLSRSIKDERLLPSVLFRGPKASRYLRQSATVMDHVATRSGMIVDSSKNATRGLIVSRQADIVTLHLIRSPRAVADSYNRRRVAKGLRKRRVWPRVRWVGKNALIWMVLGRRSNYLAVPHEWMVADPVEFGAVIARGLGSGDVEWKSENPPTVDIGGHIAVGGRVRLKGEIAVAARKVESGRFYAQFADRLRCRAMQRFGG